MGTSYSLLTSVKSSKRQTSNLNLVSVDSPSIAYQDESNDEPIKVSLRQFIQLECPIVLRALEDKSLRFLLTRHFAETFSNQTFHNYDDVLAFLERLRWKRMNKLIRITKFDFEHTPPTRFSCLPCRINEFVTLAYFDTGCSVSCVTLATAKRLRLDCQIDTRLQGIAIGFGSNRRIIGCLLAVPVQVASQLTLNVDFVVIGQSSADFLLLGADIMQRVKVCIDYGKGEINFPKQQVPLHSIRFVPNELSLRSRHLQHFKKQLLSSKDLLCKRPTDRTIDLTNDVIEENWPESKNANLYVSVRIRNCELLALIDSGADSSKISESLAKQLHLIQFVDDRQSRLSHGLGSVMSLGRLPPIPIRFSGNKLLYVPFEVLRERKLHLLLLGSDFFTHYACQVDFNLNHLLIPLQGEEEPLKFKLVHKTPNQTRVNCKNRIRIVSSSDSISRAQSDLVLDLSST